MFSKGIKGWLTAGLLWLTSLTYVQASEASIWAKLERAHARADADSALILRSKIRDPLLAPLADYWVLSSRLTLSSQRDVDQFLSRWAGTYYEDRLRNEWMRLLGKNQVWPDLLKHNQHFRMQDDLGVACWVMAARLETGQTINPAELKSLWLQKLEVQPGCAHAVRILWQQGRWPASWIWAKARTAVEYGEWRQAKAAVEIIDRRLRQAVDDVARRASKITNGYRHRAWRGHSQEVLAWAWIRIARQKPESHAKWLPAIRQAKLTGEQKQWVRSTLATWMALHHVDDAVGVYPQEVDASMADTHREWRIRSAILSHQWPQVIGWVSVLPAEIKALPQWQYWHAYARRQIGDRLANLQAAFAAKSLVEAGGYYGMLAASTWGLPMPPQQNPSVRADSAAKVRTNPGLQRAVAAYRLGLRNAGAREWNYTVALHDAQPWSDEDLRAAAQWACDLQWWQRCINTSERMRGDDALQRRFPMPAHLQIGVTARRLGIDAATVYGLIRQESRFEPEARSGAGASGLMQVMPGTARWMGRELGLSRKTMAAWRQPTTNMLLGMSYFDRLLERSGRHLSIAIASYNAGPRRVQGWLPDTPIPTVWWIEGISVNETRQYVQAVLWGAHQYRRAMNQPTSPLSQWMGETVSSGLIRSDETP